MSLFKIVHIHEYHLSKEVRELFTNLSKQISTVMADINELNQKIADLQASVDAEQQQIASLLETNAGVVTGLNETIADLKEQLSNSASPEQLEQAIGKLETIKADVESTVTPPVDGGEDTPPVDGQPPADPNA